ncbi:MAG: hypothetical protein OXK74_00650 [Gemmatimonadota bacterium]|nr:hypothetical protein [Gemmatimonadota bacterium]
MANRQEVERTHMTISSLRRRSSFGTSGGFGEGFPMCRNILPACRSSLLVAVLVATTIPATATASQWTKVGGDVDPMGEKRPVSFQRLGEPTGRRADQRTRHDEVTALVIGCVDPRPSVNIVVIGGPQRAVDGRRYFKRVGESGTDHFDVLPGTARVDDGEVHAVEWRGLGGPYRSGIHLTGESHAVAQWLTVRDELRVGEILTVAMPTHANGTFYWRFPLSGFAEHEARCPVSEPPPIRREASAQTPDLQVEVHDKAGAGGNHHEVRVRPTWGGTGRPGPMFGTDIGQADLHVYIPESLPATEVADYLAGCQYLSVKIPWGTDGFVALASDALCEKYADAPEVADLDEIRAMWLGQWLDCPVNRAVSRNQPKGVRTYWCTFAGNP